MDVKELFDLCMHFTYDTIVFGTNNYIGISIITLQYYKLLRTTAAIFRPLILKHVILLKYRVESA